MKCRSASVVAADLVRVAFTGRVRCRGCAHTIGVAAAVRTEPCDRCGDLMIVIHEPATPRAPS